MKAVLSATFLFCLIQTLPVYSKSLFEKYSSPCSINDPAINKCIVNSANKVMPHLSKGFIEYGLVPIDPLNVPKMVIGQDTGPITILFVLIDSIQSGLSNLRWHGASFNLKTGKLVLNGTLKEYNVEGKYKAKGKILVLPITGEGKCQFTMYDITLRLEILTEPVQLKGEKYLKLNRLNFHIDKLGRIRSNLTNLFNGNKALGDQMNLFMNQNNKDIGIYIKGTLEKVYSEFLSGIFKKMFQLIPYHKLFKDV